MIKLLFVLFGIGLVVTSGSCHLFYRRDYTYIAEFDAFYKFHLNTAIRSWTAAFKACDDEGAKLFYPKEDMEWTVVNNLTHANEMNTSEIILGFRDPFGFGDFVNVDGQEGNIGVTLLPTFNSAISGKSRCVYMDITSGLYNTKDCSSPESIPFVCKKVDESPCPTIDIDYTYNKEMKKCYKVNNRRTNWQEAYQTCFQEGAMLLVVENQSEANQIESIIEQGQTYHAGFSKIGTEFFTVTGKRMEKMYTMWRDEEPEPEPVAVPCDNYDDNNNCNEHIIITSTKDCGAVLKMNSNYGRLNLRTKRVQCLEALPFICEMTAKVV